MHSWSNRCYADCVAGPWPVRTLTLGPLRPFPINGACCGTGWGSVALYGNQRLMPCVCGHSLGLWMSLDTTQVYVRSMMPSSVVCVMYWMSPPLVLLRRHIMKVSSNHTLYGGLWSGVGCWLTLHILPTCLNGPGGLSTEIGFLILDESSSIYLSNHLSIYVDIDR